MAFFDVPNDEPSMTRDSPGRSVAEFSDLRPDGRFSRHEMVPGWSQKRLSESRVLVVGAGALGNEALKNLALLGVGELGVIDFDVIEPSNLPRCVLFQEEDLGGRKAIVAAKRVRELNPAVTTRPLVADVMTEVGTGFIEEFDVILGCLDNIGARYKLNRLCRLANVPWLNAGIDAFCGQVGLFDPNEGPCYECSMTTSMWHRLYETYASCNNYDSCIADWRTAGPGSDSDLDGPNTIPTLAAAWRWRTVGDPRQPLRDGCSPPQEERGVHGAS